MEESNAEVEGMQRENRRVRFEIQESYEQKLAVIARLMSGQDENERLQLGVDEMKTNIAILDDRLAGLLTDKRRAQKIIVRNERHRESLERTRTELVEMKAQVQKRSESLVKRAVDLERRRSLAAKEEKNVELYRSQVEEAEERLKVQEDLVVEYERKCDAVNENLKQEEEDLDNALFRASSMRVDSRIHRLQEMLITRTGSALTRTGAGPIGVSRAETRMTPKLGKTSARFSH
jgi:uncharacterized protein YbcI